MNNSLLVNNMYAAYSASSSWADRSVSDLSRLIRGEKAQKSETDNEIKAKAMDTVIISEEALSKLKETAI
ncbi:MAG: hypothetical protein LBD73_02355 [Deferribacteraceae bacterium]|jgi:hypothetical protein|nr:hypothetical protein [Deferribacteraceae bacterium]